MIGDEARAQLLEAAGRLPDRVIACVGGGSNAIGTFVAFVDDAEVRADRRRGRRARGSTRGATPRRSTTGARGVLHGALSAVLQDEEGQILEAHSVSAGLDYPGSGPSTPTCATPAASTTSPCPTTTRWRPSGAWPSSRGSCRRSSRRTRSPGCSRTRRRRGLDLVTLSGRGDKDLAEVLALGEP